LSHGYWAENEDGIIDTYYRRINMTIANMVSKFGLKNCHEDVQKKYKAKKYDDEYIVIHAVEPSVLSNYKKRGSKQKPFISIYVDEKNKHMLKDGWFDSFPYATPRYYKAAGEVYARGPAVTALPDMKMLNQMMKTTIVAAEKEVDPPMQAPSDTYIKPIRTVPGGINFYNPGSKDRIERLFDSRGVPLSRDFMDELRLRIRQIFFNDQLELGHRPEMTATEVIQRTEDMLRLMGPILGRMQNEGLNIIINRTFDILLKQGKFGEVPSIIADEGADIEIIYTSPIARAQRQLEVGGFQRLIEIITPVANIDPQVFSRLDTDEILEVFADLLGVRPTIVKPRDEAFEEEESNQQLADGMAVAETAKTGSEALLNFTKAQQMGVGGGSV